uniref:NADH dehydrogenase subunit 6 n=1 Tax=Echidna nebulosa TaxID=586818 RepID=UPI001E741895|nr:NADH dehydrogenase subunit 6 [Echidna nebulosa]UEX93207.1 NADH dehydrogenase subunit 6 [Gymnothorax kidako]WEQ71808.1 NADH dehydrogenase subunit 6 [Echidna nebulosa]WNH17666.1 NADH dehydrogenase subunit 6 [Echidna nebulosa]
MEYFVLLFMVLLVLGVLGVASNPAPYFAALGLVLGAGGGCGMLAGYGGSFVSLVLLLIYLGGMLVVFAYSAALAAEPYPESWGDWSVLGYVVGYVLLCIVGAFLCIGGPEQGPYMVDESHELSAIRGDFGGVSFMYYLGGEMLMICGWALLLTLFVVLELSRGRERGALRAI